MDIIKKGFGKNLKTLRKIKDFTQEKLAENIGINLRQLARIEAGESFVTSETLLNICTTLQVSPKDLFDYDINELYLMTGTDNNMHFSVIRSGKIIQLIKNNNLNEPDDVKTDTGQSDIDKKMINMSKKLQKDITVDELEDGIIKYTKIYKPSGEIEYFNKSGELKGFENLRNKIQNISNDSMKLEFMNLAFDSLFDRNALNELKILIKGIELTQS